MAEQQEQVLIEVKFDTSTVANAQKALQQNLAQLRENKKELAALQKEIKNGNDLTATGAKRYAELNAMIEENKRAIKSNTAIIQAATAERKNENDSLDEQRQYLNTLQKAYAGLSADQKKAMDEAMGGAGKLEEAIKAVNDSLVAQEHAIGENGRNVGNYTESIEKAFGQMAQAGELISPAVSILRGMGKEGQKAAATLDALGKVMQLVGKAGRTVTTATQAQTAATTAQATATKGAMVAQEGLNAVMAANPIGLIVAGISTLLPLIKSFTSDTEDATRAQEEFNKKQRELDEQIRTADEQYQRYINQKKYQNLTKAAKAEYDILETQVTDIEKQLPGLQARNEQSLNMLANATTEAEKLAAIKMSTQRQIDELKAQRASLIQQQTDIVNDQNNIVIKATENTTSLMDKVNKFLSGQYIKKGIETIENNINDMLVRMGVKTKEETDKAEETITSVADIPAPDFNKIAQLWGLDDEGLEYLKKQVEAGVDLWDALNDAIDDMMRRHLGKIGEEMAQWSSAIMGSIRNIFEYANTVEEADLENFKNQQDDKKKALDDRLKKGIISEAQYDKQVAALEAETDRREKEMSREQAKRNKAFGIMQAAIDTALSIINAFATTPFPASIAMAALAAATGAASIATIAAEPLPQFASGGVVQGTSYTGDNVQARVNSGEMILNREQQTRLFDALSSNNNTLGIDYEAMAAANAALPAPVVVYSEMQEFGQKVTTYNEIASI